MESPGEPVGLMFCLDCMYKHSRDLEHHLEDAVRVTSGSEREGYEKMIDTMRELRKVILQKIKSAPEGGECPTCSANPNPVEREERIVEIEGEKYRQVIEPVKPKEEFAPESFRTICPKCPPFGYAGRCDQCPPEIAHTTTRIIIGCPSGEWDAETQRCKVSTEIHLIYHELELVGERG